MSRLYCASLCVCGILLLPGVAPSADPPSKLPPATSPGTRPVDWSTKDLKALGDGELRNLLSSRPKSRTGMLVTFCEIMCFWR